MYQKYGSYVFSYIWLSFCPVDKFCISKYLLTMKPDVTDEGEVWDYKSLKRGRKKRTVATVKISPNIAHASRDSRKATTKSSRRSSTTKNKKSEQSSLSSSALNIQTETNSSNYRKSNKITAVKKQNQHEGYCPVCQMPFSILLLQSPGWHVAECMELPALSSEGTLIY